MNKSRLKHFLKRREEDVAYERGIEAHGNIPRKIEANKKQSQTDRLKYTGGDRRREQIARDPIAKGVAAGRPLRTGSGIKSSGALRAIATGLRTSSGLR